jgi:molybdopterin molybdotransferase
MLNVEAALRVVLDCVQPLPPQQVDLEASLGCILAEPVVSDIDSPPHDKSIVDGYALIAADVNQPGVELTVLEEITAGTMPTRTVERGAATRIMTGAPLPRGADAVVMVEQTQAAGDRVRILQSPVKPGQNIMRRAASLARGHTVLEPGQRLRAIEIGLLAEVGRSKVVAIPAPRVAVLATGNELVEASRLPGPAQIRNSNGPLLAGLVTQAGGKAVSLGIARDELDDLRKNIAAGLTRDVLLLSGGVSAGALDLVPQALADLGVQQVFHKVNLKPGKPLWFGVKEQTLVFGLPGNPVSSLVCFELFVRPAIEKLSGRVPRGLPRVRATLTRDHQQRGDRPTYWPAVLSETGAAPAVEPLAWQGSGDLRTLTGANGLAHFPAGDRLFTAGEMIDVLRLPGD